mmetsp:Transcript_68366/g.154798  ORF Transcript_68366/g.154798 Transcript_68366/m.154798 type:complete len:158 (-) Transcript_68366:73-546(-)
MGQELSHVSGMSAQEVRDGQPLFMPPGVGGTSLLDMGPLGIRGAATGSTQPERRTSPSEPEPFSFAGSSLMGPVPDGEEFLMGGPATISTRPPSQVGPGALVWLEAAGAPAAAAAAQPGSSDVVPTVAEQALSAPHRPRSVDLSKVFVSSSARRTEI